ncbi:hypothetical protein M3Y97_01136800 [Aphelenchoides bicaudatus]|nr:hypothetical protein M3Y97_01136800 [Aphelenchoides bicaudatus]
MKALVLLLVLSAGVAAKKNAIECYKCLGDQDECEKPETETCPHLNDFCVSIKVLDKTVAMGCASTNPFTRDVDKYEPFLGACNNQAGWTVCLCSDSDLCNGKTYPFNDMIGQVLAKTDYFLELKSIYGQMRIFTGSSPNFRQFNGTESALSGGTSSFIFGILLGIGISTVCCVVVAAIIYVCTKSKKPHYFDPQETQFSSNDSRKDNSKEAVEMKLFGLLLLCLLLVIQLTNTHSFKFSNFWSSSHNVATPHKKDFFQLVNEKIPYGKDKFKGSGKSDLFMAPEDIENNVCVVGCSEKIKCPKPSKDECKQLKEHKCNLKDLARKKAVECFDLCASTNVWKNGAFKMNINDGYCSCFNAQNECKKMEAMENNAGSHQLCLALVIFVLFWTL